jgi:hypothetical protein
MGEQLELGANRSWVRGLEQEIALKLAPHLGVEKVKELAAGLARLAERRAAEAQVVPPSSVLCQGCSASVLLVESTHLCPGCANNTMMVVG